MSVKVNLSGESKIATRESYGKALAELGNKYPELVVLDADLAGATKTEIFQKVFPDRHIDCGIAEANMWVSQQDLLPAERSHLHLLLQCLLLAERSNRSGIQSLIRN